MKKKKVDMLVTVEKIYEKAGVMIAWICATGIFLLREKVATLTGGVEAIKLELESSKSLDEEVMILRKWVPKLGEVSRLRLVIAWLSRKTNKKIL